MKEQRATDARDRRSALLIEDREAFLQMLRMELYEHRYNAETQGMTPAVRLNGTSDIVWHLEHPELFEEFGDIKFYDYTKLYLLMMTFLFPDRCPAMEWPEPPSNYHLTFSLSERNVHHAREILECGGNVAAVFWPELPEAWMGYPVIDGDKSDARFLDKGPAVIGLSAKGFVAQEGDLTGFVIRTDQSEPTVLSRRVSNNCAA